MHFYDKKKPPAPLRTGVGSPKPPGAEPRRTKRTLGLSPYREKHPRGLLGTQVAHLCGQNAAIESITVFKHLFERFLVPFWRGRPIE